MQIIFKKYILCKNDVKKRDLCLLSSKGFAKRLVTDSKKHAINHAND